MLVVLPVRLDSTRLPRKPLLMVGGEPLIAKVVREIQALELDGEVVVATDSAEIADAVGTLALVVMTGRHHRNGTERVAAVAALPSFAKEQIIINIQPDQLGVRGEMVHAAMAMVLYHRFDIGTVAMQCTEEQESQQDKVKVLLDAEVDGLCRAFRRQTYGEQVPGIRLGLHVGIYAYRASALRHWVAEVPIREEREQGLEQLRPLCAGIRIGAAWVDGEAPRTINTVEDLELAREGVC